MGPPATIFNNNLVVTDAMVIINFHGLLALDKLISWAQGEIVVERKVKEEATHSKAGHIDLAPYIENGSIKYEEIEGEEQENLFFHYFNSRTAGAAIHEGDASCLALAISKGYGLACDEKVLREEFKRKCPDKICVNSWDIVNKANKLGLISADNANDLKKGLFYV